MNISKILSLGPVMPVIVIEQPEHAIPLGEALLAGGINTIEITLRTTTALSAIEYLAKSLPEIYVGAGTILTKQALEPLPQLLMLVVNTIYPYYLAPVQSPKC